MLAALKTMLPGVLGPLLDRIPDPNERNRLESQTQNALMAAVSGLLQGQIEINKKEAEHPSIFVAGWRPFIGWVCGVGVAWAFVFRPLIVWGAYLAGYDLTDAPVLNNGELMSLLMAMLGVTGIRSFDKLKGTARSSWSDRRKRRRRNRGEDEDDG